MSGWVPMKYKTTNRSAYNEALRQLGSLSIRFDPDMVWNPPPTGGRGRQQSFGAAAIQTRLTMKVPFGPPLRQTPGFVESLPRPVGLDWPVPDFGTLCRRQRRLNATVPHRGGPGPSRPPIDSTGIEAEGEDEWNAREHGGLRRRVRRKIHIGIDEETLEVRAVEIAGGTVGDAPMLPEPVARIPPDREIGSVVADGAHGHAREPRGDRAARREIPGPGSLAKMDRLSPPEPCREQDEPRQAARHTCHEGREISPHGKRGRPTFI